MFPSPFPSKKEFYTLSLQLPRPPLQRAYDVQRLLDIANSPLTNENIKVIAEIVASMEMLIKDDYNEFSELAELSGNLN